MNVAVRMGVAVLVMLLSGTAFGAWTTASWPADNFGKHRFNMKAIVKDIKEGAIPFDGDYVDDPAYLNFLESSAQRGSQFYNNTYYPELLRHAAHTLGRRLVPFLLEELRTAKDEGVGGIEGEWRRLDVVASALCGAVTVDDIPALREIILGGDRRRSDCAFSSLNELKRGTDTEFLFALHAATDDCLIRHNCLSLLDRLGTKDLTPRLMELSKQAGPAERIDIVLALNGIWGLANPDREDLQVPVQASEAQQALWEADVRKLVGEELMRGKPDGARQRSDEGKRMARAWSDLVCLAGHMKLDESFPLLVDLQQEEEVNWAALYTLLEMGTERSARAVDDLIPFLVKQKDEGHVDLRVRGALVKMGSERSIAALIDLTRTEHGETLCELLIDLAEINGTAAIPRMLEMLLDNDPELDNPNLCSGETVRDRVVFVLSVLCPDGPGTVDIRAAMQAAHEAKLEEWRAYLEKQAPEGK